MLTSVLFLSVCFLAYANGANDNFKGVASLFGSGILNYRQAVAWATLTTLAGSIAALFLAQTLLIKFSGKGLAPDALIHTLPFMIAVAGGAGVTVILATRFGFPVSTTHALLGAMAGSTLLATSGAISLSPLLNNFVTPLLISPVLALLLAPNMTEQGIILAVGLAMLAGGVLHARRVAETMSHKITAIGHDQGLSANLVTAFLVIFASELGMPVSTTHVAVGSLFGIGLVTGKANTGVIASIALSWLLTLPCAAVSAMAIYFIALGH